MSKCKSFAPAINENSKILILGSMPGIKSLEETQYYAHPQNRFWKVMSILCNVDMVSMDYEKLKKISKYKNNLFKRKQSLQRLQKIFPRILANVY